MGLPMTDIHCYSTDNVLRQIQGAMPVLGAYTVSFYSLNGRPSRKPSDTLLDFLYYPSGGTIRDTNMNILFYEPKLDAYHPSNRK